MSRMDGKKTHTHTHKSGQRGDIHICEPGRRRTNFYWISVAIGGRKDQVRYVLSRAKGATCTFVSREGGVQTFIGHPWPKGDGKSE